MATRRCRTIRRHLCKACIDAVILPVLVCVSKFDDSVQTTAGYDVPLNEESIKRIQLVKLSRTNLAILSVEKARKVSARGIDLIAGTYSFNGTIRDLRVPSSEVQDGIPVRVYRPNHLPPDPAIMVYFHGGGHVLGSIETHDVCCKMLSTLCECIIVSVEYRLAPENKFPAGLDDADVATQWVLDNRTKVGGTEKSVVGVAGDSAGGQVASLTPHYVRGLSFQVLVYARTDERANLPSHQEFIDGPVLTKDLVRWFKENRLTNIEEDIHNPRYSALQQARFDHLPPALFVVAECDPLRDDSYAYHDTLKEAGVQSELLLIKGAIHGFFSIPGLCKDNCAEAYGTVSRFIKKIAYGEQ